jgi:hypothetical protein
MSRHTLIHDAIAASINLLEELDGVGWHERFGALVVQAHLTLDRLKRLGVGGLVGIEALRKERVLLRILKREKVVVGSGMRDRQQKF